MRPVDADAILEEIGEEPEAWFDDGYQLGLRDQYRYDVDIIKAAPTLRKQEPRIITLNELTDFYVEFKGNDCPVRLSNFDLQKIIMYIEDGSCRLWTHKPTDRQKMAVKWND